MATFWLEYQSTRFPIRRGETVIGRSPYCTIVLNNALISRQHCAIRCDGEHLYLDDLGSSNGTFVNGRLTRGTTRLKEGDLVRVGTDNVRVISLEMAPAQRRRASTVNEPGVTEWDGAEDTKTFRASVDLIEALVKNAATLAEPATMIAPIREAIESLLRAEESGRASIETQERKRLLSAIEGLGQLTDDPQVRAWQKRIHQKLETRRL